MGGVGAAGGGLGGVGWVVVRGSDVQHHTLAYSHDCCMIGD